MKRAYTQMATYLKVMAKSKGVEPGQLINAWREHFIDGPRASPTAGELTSFYALLIDYKILSGKAVHLFMPGLEFCDWLVSCVPELDSNHAAVIQQSVGDYAAGVLHFPCASQKSSVGFLVPAETATVDGLRGPDYGCLYMSFSRELESPANATVTLDSTAGGSKTTMWYARLVVGLGMYLGCFPDAARDGAPEDVKHPSHHQYERSRTILLSEKVSQQSEHGSPTPHFRRGHFRVLRSEQFTKKRFQVVFVRESFVKGHAKTVLAPEEVAT